jgi:predicted ATPase
VNTALEQFLKAADQIAGVARFDVIRLGIVATNTTANPSIIVALSAMLTRGALESTPLPTLNAGPITAFQLHVPMRELHPLLHQLEQGKLERIRTPDGKEVEFAPVLVVPTEMMKEGSWYFDRSSSFIFGPSCKVYSSGNRLRGIIQFDELTDTLIAEESEYAYASLARVIKAFTGLQVGRSGWNQQCQIECVVPWPIYSIAANRLGSTTQVVVEGITGLDSSKFILNVEGGHKDHKLDATLLRWQIAAAAAGDKATYTTRFDVEDSEPAAVNFYVAKVPIVQLRADVRREEAPISSSPVRDLLESVSWHGIHQPREEPQHVEAHQDSRLIGLRVSGFRLLQSVELKWAPPFVVIVGPNQSGKSSVLEALQLLSEAAKGELSEALVRRRGGLGAVLTRGGRNSTVTLEADLGTPETPAVRYRLSVSPVGSYDFTVADEQLSQQVDGRWEPLLVRRGHQATLAGVSLSVPNERESMLSQLGITHPLIEVIRTSLAAIAIYPYFRTGAAWADLEAVPMRRPARLEPGARLNRSGDNLAAALFSMRDERPEDWDEYLGIVRLAFPNLKDLRMPAVSRGSVQLFWDDISGQSFDAAELSDGTLSFLAILCALFQPGSALIAVDEPEQHLHPDALRRLVGAARSLSDRQPILFTTQSDALIGLLDDAPESVVVASRGPGGSILVRPDSGQLQEWLKTFSLREMRRELEGWSPES